MSTCMVCSTDYPCMQFLIVTKMSASKLMDQIWFHVAPLKKCSRNGWGTGIKQQVPLFFSLVAALLFY